MHLWPALGGWPASCNAHLADALTGQAGHDRAGSGGAEHNGSILVQSQQARALRLLNYWAQIVRIRLQGGVVASVVSGASAYVMPRPCSLKD